MSMQNKTILHIANDYAGSKVYKNLVYELDQLEVQQIIYTAIRGKNKIGSNEINFQVKDSKTIYSAILNWHIDRVFYPLKVAKIFRDIKSKVDFSQIQCIHAHTWYSDGGVAYLLSKKYNIPFIIAVRNTDINIFQKKLVYLRPYGRKIINSASQVIIISESYKDKLLTLNSLAKIKNNLKSKLKVIPNGVANYWIKNRVSEKKNIGVADTVNVLYIGNFSNSKQVLSLQRAIILLNSQQEKTIKLHLVGGSGRDESAVLKLVKDHPSLMKYHGKVHDKKKLKDIFQSCDIFAMPSLKETFGLVYVEAMLQGMPILYTEGQGIDGFYSEKIGEKISEHSIESIKKVLSHMIINLNEYTIPINKMSKAHDWRLIAKKYQEIYQDCIDKYYQKR